MSADKKRKQLLNRLKKREKKGIAKPAVVKPLTMKVGERNRFTNKNPMVLLAIEKTILALAEDQVGLDDRCVRVALTSLIRSINARLGHRGEVLEEASAVVALRDKSSESLLAEQLAENLNKRCESFFPANDSQTINVWGDGLRAIYTSMCSVSDFAPGEDSYLRSAARFLAQATNG